VGPMHDKVSDFFFRWRVLAEDWPAPAFGTSDSWSASVQPCPFSSSSSRVVQLHRKAWQVVHRAPPPVPGRTCYAWACRCPFAWSSSLQFQCFLERVSTSAKVPRVCVSLRLPCSLSLVPILHMSCTCTDPAQGRVNSQLISSARFPTRC